MPGEKLNSNNDLVVKQSTDLEQDQNTDLEKRHNVFGDIGDHIKGRESLEWEGDFSEYIEKVMENPSIARTAYQTTYGAVTSRPDFFTSGRNALYGAERSTEHFLDILKGGAEGLEIGKRIILLLGPPGSGKSTLVNGTKRGIEDYTRTDEGAVYAIADCPMQEEPLHLIPKELRPSLAEQHEIHIDGDLCPRCAKKYGGQGMSADTLKNVPVKRVFFSERDRIGIGTFKPSDPKSQDITELVGSVDLSKLGEFGSGSDADAYQFDGELNVANRGMMEFVEMLKSDEKFLYSLLDLTQDRVIKAPRFPNISADEVILAHTNMTEYKAYVEDPRNEALRDRMVVVSVPYALRVSDEQKIYEKLIGQSEIAKRNKMHVNPHTLEVAAMFSVMSRLHEGKYSKIEKMKIYDGKASEGISQRDIKEMHEKSKNEGMSGVSPRYVIDSLSSALTQNDPRTGESKKCLTPNDAIRALRNNIDHHPHTRDMDEKAKAVFLEDLGMAKKVYDDQAKEEVQQAFIHAFDDSMETLASKYLDNIAAFCSKSKIADQYDDEAEHEPDERLMRSIEEQIRITESGKKEFRQELMNSMAQSIFKGNQFNYANHPMLAKAVKGKMYADTKDLMKMTTSASIPDKKQQKRIDTAMSTLIEDYGHCENCAAEILRNVGQALAREA